MSEHSVKVSSRSAAAKSNYQRPVQSDVTELNETELARFSFWRTDQRASRANPLVIGWRVRKRSHVAIDAARRLPIGQFVKN